MDDLSKKSKEELLSDLETVNKFIQGHNNSLQEADDYFIENGEVWLIDSIHKKRAADLINDKTGQPVYTQKRLKHIKNNLIDRSKLIHRQNLLKLEIKKGELGSDYFDYEEKPDFKNDFNEAKSLREFLLRIREYSPYSYYLLDNIKFTPERVDDKKYVIWITIFTKPSDNSSKKLSTESSGYPFNLSDIGIVEIKPPELIKKYLKVNIMQIPDSETREEAKAIRMQLINSGGTYTIELDNIHYYCVVEKNPEYVNYYLYKLEEYYKFLENLKISFLNYSRDINDEEYIRLFITLNEWRRKYQNTSTQKIVEFFQEIEGVFQSWYFERKLSVPDFLNYTLALRKKTLSLISEILALKSKLQTLNSELEEIESQFDKDITEFPDDFSQQVRAKQNEIENTEVELKELEYIFWGTTQSVVKGLYWKSEKMELAYIKYKINDDLLFEQQYNKYYDKDAVRIKQKIKELAELRGIEVNNVMIDDIFTEVMGIRYGDDDQFLEELINPALKKTNTEKTINDVIAITFNIKIAEPLSADFEFATPRANANSRLLELNQIISSLELQKVTQANNISFIQNLNKQIDFYKIEAKELNIKQVRDARLFSVIREMTSGHLELNKNIYGLTYLEEVRYNEFNTAIIEEITYKIFNFICNNNYDRVLQKPELFKIIDEEIPKQLSEMNYFASQVTPVKGLNTDDENVIKIKVTQRQKIVDYLKEHYPEFLNTHDLKMGDIAAEVTSSLYPSLTTSKTKKKINSIRRELYMYRYGVFKSL